MKTVSAHIWTSKIKATRRKRVYEHIKSLSQHKGCICFHLPGIWSCFNFLSLYLSGDFTQSGMNNVGHIRRLWWETLIVQYKTDNNSDDNDISNFS